MTLVWPYFSLREILEAEDSNPSASNEKEEETMSQTQEKGDHLVE
jgi:hypothetical protein